MSKKQSPALRDLISLRKKLARGRPNFATAVENEQRVELFCKDVRAQLKARREQYGLDQNSIAKRLEINQSAVSKIENGTGDIGLKTLFRYADALGAKPVVLFIPSESQIAQQMVESREEDGPDEGHIATAGAVQAAQEHFIRAVSDTLPQLVAKITGV